MKELTIEEKAKAYDEALKRAKEYYNKGKVVEFANYVASDIFPELKEGEDERIRKHLISFVENWKIFNPNSALDDYPIFTSDRCEIDKILAWLEKQGEKKQDVRYENLEELLVADNIYQMAMNDEMVQEAKEKAINALSEMCIGRLLGVEKQGEQKVSYTTLVETGDGGINAVVTEELSTDKVEPRFKVGVWITIDKPCQIISINDNRNYIVQYCDDEKTHVLSKKFCETYFHLWTIKDAKDGDVLTYNDSKNNIWVCIFKEYANERVYDYCTLDKESFWEHGNWNYLASFSYTPATKEQRDLLFQKMKEAGYEWDAEKKELEKIIDEKQIKKMGTPIEQSKKLLSLGLDPSTADMM